MVRNRRETNLIKTPNGLLPWAVIFDGPNLTALQAAIFASVRVVFLDCPLLDCLYHVVTTSTVGVTTFTNHSVEGPKFLIQYTFRPIKKISLLTNPKGPCYLSVQSNFKVRRLHKQFLARFWGRGK